VATTTGVRVGAGRCAVDPGVPAGGGRLVGGGGGPGSGTGRRRPVLTCRIDRPHGMRIALPGRLVLGLGREPGQLRSGRLALPALRGPPRLASGDAVGGAAIPARGAPGNVGDPDVASGQLALPRIAVVHLRDPR
jgi:hypothetical protein